MKGLVIKDCLVLKKTVLQMFFVLCIFCIVGILTQNQFFVLFPSIYLSLLITTVMTWDERCNFNHFACIMPVKKSDIVISKYIMGAILCVGSIIVGIFTSIFMNGLVVEKLLESVVVNCSISIIYQSFMLPIMFKYGVEKSRITLFVVYIVIFAFSGGVVFLILKSDVDFIFILNVFNRLNQFTVFILNLLFLAVVYIFSMLISIAINKNKEW